jgi:hypothetical protein
MERTTADEKFALSRELIEILFSSKIERAKFVVRSRHARNSQETNTQLRNFDSLKPVCTANVLVKVQNQKLERQRFD